MDRRSTYFAFQGLLMAVLLLLFIYQYQGDEGRGPRLACLVLVLGSSLIFLRAVPPGTLARGWVQLGLFLGDSAVATWVLHWVHPRSELYLIYLLIIFGTALTRKFTQSFLVAAITSLLYFFSLWNPVHGFPSDTAFWLRVLFLWVSTFVLAILARDAQQAQKDQENKYQERLISIERLATLGQMAAEVAHRIKAPLTTILVNAEILSQRRQSVRERKELRQIQEQVQHCKGILKNLLDLGRIEDMDWQRLDLREPIQRALEAASAQMTKRGLRVEARGLEEPCLVHGDASLLQEAVAAVIQNAIEAASRRGMIRLSLQGGSDHSWWGSLRDCALVISDDGKGIVSQDLERIFQPFFTTKGKSGSGLGLSAALRIMQKHHGTIQVFSEGRGKGAKFTLILPRVPL